MAKIKGKDCDFAITTAEVLTAGPFSEATGTMTRVEAQSNEVTLSIDAKTVDSSAYGDATPNTELVFGKGALDLTKKAFTFYPNGFNATPSATQPEYSGRVLIQSVSTNPDRSGLVSLRVSLQGDGQLHRVVA
jgi:hypothetical protein